MLNLLSDPLIDTRPAGHLDLPGVLAAMARGAVQEFPALRPHQRAAWHCFLVQLGALALSRAGGTDLPTDAGAWREMLAALTGGPGPWALIADDDAPAFMQPPAPKGLGWKAVATPDALDLLITARNHDLKQQIARDNQPQDWIFALISLQTSEGYGGPKNFGIARMNAGSSSRAMLAFVPDPEGRGGLDPSVWWRRDVTALLRLRAEGRENVPGQPGGDALLWCLPWPDGAQLDLTRLDPWFIEVCRRIRLTQTDGRITARRSISAAERIAAKQFAGVTGDPWAPIAVEKPRSLTIGEGEFDYKRMNELLFSGKWKRPPLAEPQGDEGDGLIVAEALGRGNAKTDGMKSRIVPVPGRVVGMLWDTSMATLATQQIDEIARFDAALKFGLATAAADGARDLSKDNYTRSRPGRDAFDARADALFFPALFDRVACDAADGPAGQEAAQQRFLIALLAAARDEFETALDAIPITAIRRPRADARARRAFEGTLRRADFAYLIGFRAERKSPDGQ